MQKSLRGLLQTILYYLFRSSPSIVNTLCPDRLAGDPWNMDELRAVFTKLSKETCMGTKYCFFIDGLDEYDGAEEDIIQIVKALAASKHIKICVSSRPWPAFSAEWDPSDQTLRLQDFCKDDMDKYIHDLLVGNERFAALGQTDAPYFELIPKVSMRAQGVWLWVFLVERDLLRDMRDNEPYGQLLVRLNSYPQELKYFDDILNRIDKVYYVDSAHIFLFVVSAVEPLSVLALTHLKDWDDPSAIYNEWVPRLQNRCRDLLTITGFKSGHAALSYRVGFLHRTVRDFLTDEYQSKLLQRARKGFDAHIVLSRLTLLLMKRLDFEMRSGQ
jgi:hypothetical protein